MLVFLLQFLLIILNELLCNYKKYNIILCKIINLKCKSIICMLRNICRSTIISIMYFIKNKNKYEYA